jgi:hypothetical protein
MRRRHRIVVGLLIAVCGIAIAVGSELGWISASGARPASGINHTSLKSLVHWSYQSTSTYLLSFAFAVVVVGVLVFIGGVFGSRVLAGFFSLIALALAGTWLALNVNK